MSLSTTQYGYIVDPMIPFTDDKGKTIKNGFIRVFMAGTSTPVLTYRNYDGATNQEKIELDNSGRVKHNVIGSKGSLYKVVVYNILHSQENPLLTVDKIAVLGASINATGATIVTGLDSVTVQEENFIKATVEGTGVELALDPTEVTSEVSTTAAAVTAAPDYVVPLLDKTGEGDSKKISLANLFKFALDWISRLATTITSFASGDFIAVSNPTDGTRKMSKDTLLTLTAQNALANNVASAFDPAKPNDDGGYAYYADEIVANNGATYRFKVNHSSGAWNASEVERYDASESLKFLLVTDNPEYLYAVTNEDGIFLFGVKEDGSIDWQKGVPQPVKKFVKDNIEIVSQAVSELQQSVSNINETLILKVDKVQGKSLIDSYVAEHNLSRENIEYQYVLMDSQERIIFGVTENGILEFPYVREQIHKYIEDVGGLATVEYVDDKVAEEEERALAAERVLQEAIDGINPTQVIGGENNPDEEFLTTIDEKITLKNKLAGIGSFGRKIFRQSDFFELDDAYTIYDIRYAFNLGGATIEVPSNCILFFNGGQLYNGTIVGDDTRIFRINDFIFGSDISFSGSWLVDKISSRMIEGSTSANVLKRLCSLLNDDYYNEFYIAKESTPYVFAPLQNDDIFISLKSNTKLIVDGTLQITPNGYTHYNLVNSVAGKKNIEICGSGTISGDADDHDYVTTQSSHEWGHCIRVGGSNIRIHGLTLQNATGDGVDTIADDIHIHDVVISHCGRQGISVSEGHNIVIDNIDISDIYRVAPRGAIDVEGERGVTIKNVKISNVVMNSSYGLYFLDCDGIDVHNIISISCQQLLFGRNCKDISVRKLKNSGSVTGAAQKWINFENTCERVSLDDSVVASESAVNADISNVRVGPTLEFLGAVVVTGSPVASSVKYDNGKYIQFNGTSWVNFDGYQTN